jgi:hypothetical protein
MNHQTKSIIEQTRKLVRSQGCPNLRQHEIDCFNNLSNLITANRYKLTLTSETNEPDSYINKELVEAIFGIESYHEREQKIRLEAADVAKREKQCRLDREQLAIRRNEQSSRVTTLKRIINIQNKFNLSLNNAMQLKYEYNIIISKI